MCNVQSITITKHECYCFVFSCICYSSLSSVDRISSIYLVLILLLNYFSFDISFIFLSESMFSLYHLLPSLLSRGCYLTPVPSFSPRGEFPPSFLGDNYLAQYRYKTAASRNIDGWGVQVMTTDPKIYVFFFLAPCTFCSRCHDRPTTCLSAARKWLGWLLILQRTLFLRQYFE